MGKTSLKTFVCSFVFSLFTILSVNKEFFSVPKPSDTEIKIPNKNISLFFKSLPSPAKAAKTIPVKKIALSVPVSPSTEKLSEVSAEDPIPLTFAGNDIEFDLNEKTAEASVKAAEAVSAPQPAPQQTVSKAELSAVLPRLTKTNYSSRLKTRFRSAIKSFRPKFRLSAPTKNGPGRRK